MQGDRELAAALCGDATELGALPGLSGYPLTMATWFSAFVAALDGRPEDAVAISDEGKRQAEAHGVVMFVPMLNGIGVWASGVLGDPERAAASLDETLAFMGAAGVRMMAPFWQALRARRGAQGRRLCGGEQVRRRCTGRCRRNRGTMVRGRAAPVAG